MKKIFLFLLLLAPLFAEEQNALIVTDNSQETLFWMHEFIDQANQSIEFVTYTTGGKAFCDLIQAIGKRMEVKTEVKAFVLVSPLLIFDQESLALSQLKQKFPDRFHFQMTGSRFTAIPDYVVNENHIKCLIVDEKYYITGGTNLHAAFCTTGTFPIERDFGSEGISSSLPSGTRDMDVVGRGFIARDLREMYYKIYALWEHFEIGGLFEPDPEKFQNNRFFQVPNDKACIARFDHSPDKIEAPQIKMIISAPCQKNPITQEYINLVKGAKKEIKIANFYFNPVFPLFEELRKSVRRGISIHLITNGKWEHSPFYCNFLASGNRVNYVPLLFGHEYHFWQWWEVTQTPHYSTKIFEFEVNDVLYHKKVMVVDQRYTVIGSYNLNPKSDYGDFELVLVIDSEPTAKAVLKVLEKDRTFSREIGRDFAIDWYFDPLHAYEGAFQKLFQGFL